MDEKTKQFFLEKLLKTYGNLQTDCIIKKYESEHTSSDLNNTGMIEAWLKRHHFIID